jgi:16S rRNA (guanine1207-N2)-methyltransferase
MLPRDLSPETRAWLEHLRRDIVFSERLLGHQLTFHTTWGLFSPKAIDEGTRLLLNHLEVREDDRALDLGCGYGPIGLAIAAAAPRAQTLMVDKDFVAVDYANANARRNGLENARARLSNGFEQLGDRRFDLIVSNLPAKTNKEQYYLYFYEALARLTPGGRIWLVTISSLRKFVQRAFGEVFGNYEKVKQGRSYTVAMAVKSG